MKDMCYRAWDVKRSEMMDWEAITGHCSTMYKVLCNPGDEYALMQYTGLKDRKGVEIYEGDIVSIKDGFIESQYEVYWSDYGFSLIHAKRHGDDYGVYTRKFALSKDVYTIIGNIHEHPHLLT